MTDTRALRHDDLWSIPLPSDPQMSPDGTCVAYVLTTPRRESDDYCSEICWVDTVGGPPRRVTAGPRDAAPRWSPDGSALAFLRALDGKGAPQLWLLPVAGGEPYRLTDLPGGAGPAVWSPDGSSIAFSALVDGDGSANEHRPVVADRLDYKVDGVGLVKGRRTQLFVIPAAGGPARQLTFGDSSASGPAWSPDGTQLAYTCAAGRDRDLRPNASVLTVPTAGGRPRRIGPERGVYRLTDWSADGSSLLITGSEELNGGNDGLFLLPAAGGPLEQLAKDLDRNIMPGEPGYPGALPRFGDDARTVTFCARDRGAVHVFTTVPGGQAELLLGGERVVAGVSRSAGRVAFVAADATSPGEVWLYDKDGDRRLTALFSTALPDVELVKPEPVESSAPDGTPIHGWILRGKVDGPTPLLLDVHGGPHNAWGPAFDGAHIYQQTLVAAGWTVLIVNPRGSDGYGDDFRRAVVGGWGRSDQEDFLSAVDALVERGLADPDRLAVSGYSYGGFTTCWLTGHVSRFKAGVAGGCVSNLVSLAGTSDFGLHLAQVEIGGAVTDESAGLLLAMSPITYAGSVTTPTLILHGEKDDRCPVGQAEEWFAALRQNGTPTRLVRYPGGSHLFILNGRPSHRVDYGQRIEDWVVRHTEPSVAVRASGRVRAGDLSGRLNELIARHNVPGASVAVLSDGELVTAAAGKLNLDTGVPATPQSMFQIGSITKVYTATLAMQLVDEGRLELDAPIARYLPGFRLANDTVAASVTMRHLLSHTSGIEGDHFRDTGRGDDCVAKLVESCAEIGQTHPLGATMSYCNTGYVIAGRVIEELTGGTWDQAVRERIVGRLGLEHTVTLPEEVLLGSGAVGHVGRPGTPPKVTPVWVLPRSCGPAGIICSTAADVIAFAEAHLRGGATRSGGRLLSEPSVAAMREAQVDMPDPYSLGSQWGLGWILFDWDGHRVFGHDGNTIGQSAFLRVVPECGLAISLLVNGGNAQDLYRELFGALLQELGGITMPPRPEPPARPVEPEIDLDRHVGTYERLGVRTEIDRRGERLYATTIATGDMAAISADPKTEYELRAVTQDLFVTRLPGVQTWAPMVFYRLDDGTPYLHFGVRASPKKS